MKTVSIVVAAVVLSIGMAHARSAQNCMRECRLTAAPDSAWICQTRDGGCVRLAGVRHESDVRLRESAARKARSRGDLAGSAHASKLAGSMYEGTMSVGWTWRGSPGGRCPARAHSAGYG